MPPLALAPFIGWLQGNFLWITIGGSILLCVFHFPELDCIFLSLICHSFSINPTNTLYLHSLQEMPSPEQLKRKIIIKHKKLPEGMDEATPPICSANDSSAQSSNEECECFFIVIFHLSFFIYFHLSCSLFLILDNFQLLLDQKLQSDTCDIQTQIFFWKWIQRRKYNWYNGKYIYRTSWKISHSLSQRKM